MNQSLRAPRLIAFSLFLCGSLITCFSTAFATNWFAPDAQTLKVKVRGEPNEKAIVVVKQAGCSCGECPKGKLCPSGCCECNGNECRCCIVAKGMTDENGVATFRLQPGKYEVFVKADDKSTKASEVEITTKDKEVKIAASDLTPGKG